MTDIKDIFGGPFIPENKHVDPPEVQLADAMRNIGIAPPPNIQIDGQLHRFSTKGRKADDSGWYIVFPDEPMAGRFGCWRDQIDGVFRADVGRELTTAEHMAIVRRQAEAKKSRDAEREKKATVAASTVAKIWSEATGASSDHPYLARKGIAGHGARVTGDGRLLVPLFDQDGELSSLQYISETEKRYHPGGSTKGCLWILGDIDGGPIFIAEGYATAATVHEISNHPCAIAYSANNLPLVVGHLRQKYGDQQELIIVADHDASNVGRNKADEASAKHGGRIVMPPDIGDANDYHMAGKDLSALLFPPSDDWLVPADEFSDQPAPIKWQVKHWLQSTALVMIHGPSGGGKTFFTLDQTLSVASKGVISDWFGHKVRPGNVVYLAGEGHHGLRGRVAAWKQHNNVPSLDMWISKAGCDLNIPAGYQKAVDAIRGLPEPPDIIVVDTLHRFLNGDENSAQDAKTMLDACAGLISEFGASVILVHHTGVSEEAQHRARGSSAWRGALDIEISVVPGKNDGSIQIVQRKSKDAEEAAPVYVDLQSVPISGWRDEDGEQVTSAVIVEGAEPIKPAKAQPVDKHKKTFEKAWFIGGAVIINDIPFVSRKVMEDFLSQSHTERAVKNMLNSSYNDRLIGMLNEQNLIEKSVSGWSIIDDQWASELMIMGKK